MLNDPSHKSNESKIFKNPIITIFLRELQNKFATIADKTVKSMGFRRWMAEVHSVGWYSVFDISIAS